MSDIPDELKAALADRYALQSVIGRGGMATVYLAGDLKHNREVAVKVMRPDLARSIGIPRFLREIEIAARLSHPNVVSLFDSGESDGFLFYVMPFIKGRSLRSLLDQEKPLDPSRALAIATQVAEGLHYAHRAGVLHRDIKPENILLSDGHVYVVDFGVAKAVSTAGEATLTRTGFALGTPGYMSPEVAAGVRDIDSRADVYGLGCVLYEMIVGETPGLWLTEQAVLLGRFVDAAPEHRERLDQLPGRLEQVLSRALALRPSDRYVSPVEFTTAMARALEPSGGEYDDADLRDIVGRAAELPGEQSTSAGVLTIGALEQVAAEVGVPPERVRAAIQELGEQPRSGDAFSDSQVRDIIGRADEQEAALVTEEGLLSIGAVEQVAAQVGIPPERVRQVVRESELQAELHAADQTPGLPVPTGGPTSSPSPIRIERIVDVWADESKYAPMIQEIRSTLAMVGQITSTGRSLTWTSRPGEGSDRRVRITVTPQGRETQVYLEEYLGPVAGRIGGGMLGAAGGLIFGMATWIGMGGPQGPFVALFGLGFAIGGAYILQRSMLQNVAMQRERQLEGLADRLTALAEGRPAQLEEGPT